MKRLWNFFRTDPWRKLLALLLTGCVYFSVYISQMEKRTMDVVLTVNTAPGIFIPQELRTQKVTLTLKGSPSQLEKLYPADMEGHVTVQREGERIKLTPDHFGSAFGIGIVEITPKEIDPGAVEMETRMIAAKPGKLEGEPDKDYELDGEPVVEPSKIEVTGPPSALRGLDTIYSSPVNISGNMTSWTLHDLDNPQPDRLKFNPEKVRVSVKIREKAAQKKTIDKVPVRLLFDPLDRKRALKVQSVSTLRVSVTLSVNDAALSRITPDNIVVFADLTAARFDEPGEYSVELAADLTRLPENAQVRIDSIAPKTIKVTIAAPESETPPKK